MKKILFVDDTMPLVTEVSQILRLEGFSVINAANALLALEQLAFIIPDLILTDLLMPGIDGFQFIEEIRRTVALKTVPIIIFSAKTANHIVIRCRNVGANAFIRKPCKSHELMSTVHLLLDNPGLYVI